MTAREILCVSFSPIARDARVLRQISELAKSGSVTTVGYGPKPEGADRHVEIPEDLPSLPQTPAGVLLLALRRHRRVELMAPAAAYARTRIPDRRFDLVVANDARALPLAFEAAAGAPVWADMHEWAPEERTHVLSWRLLVAPLMDDLCRRYLPRAAAVTTVGGEIASLYRERYGVETRVVRNAPRLVGLYPSETTDDRIRLVHSGGAVPGRDIEAMIDVVRELDARFSLDLYLVAADPKATYLHALRAHTGGDPRIVFHEPVPPADLPKTLNQYDVGVFWMPPVHTNGRLTLPNKLFDFVQARLALAIGPTVEMERVVDRYGLGVVSARFDRDAYRESLAALTAEQIRAFKENSDRAAPELSFEHDAKVIQQIVAEATAAGPV